MLITCKVVDAIIEGLLENRGSLSNLVKEG